MSESRLPPATHLGAVQLRVSDLERSLYFYRDLLGLHPRADADGAMLLAATPSGPPLVALVASPGAPHRPPRTVGLYHFALLFPERVDLARVVQRLLDSRWPLAGAADHAVSEAVYLADPDGNGVELYVDRPRNLWRWEDDEVVMHTLPLDLPRLVLHFQDELGEWSGVAPGTTIGHIHLHVSDLERAEEFYSGLLGFEVTTRSYPGALFLAAGGYHHHLGLNTWTSPRGARPPAGAAGLLAFEIVIPDHELLDRIHHDAVRRDVGIEPTQAGWRLLDQDGNAVLLRAG
jgi:catechol 2,3-dioxygenase